MKLLIYEIKEPYSGYEIKNGCPICISQFENNMHKKQLNEINMRCVGDSNSQSQPLKQNVWQELRKFPVT